MNSISSVSKLAFFKTEKYEYALHHVFDASSCPRPHFCMGLLLDGHAEFYDCESSETIEVGPGDIIFVPIASRYISTWNGEPQIAYVSMHFIFDGLSPFSRRQNFRLQKLGAGSVPNARELFEAILRRENGDAATQLSVLGQFYGILSTILPQLKTRRPRPMDSRINIAVEYIEKRYDEEISIDALAKLCNISASRFFPCFKASMGVTPIEYLHHCRISRAIILLMNDCEASIESVGEAVGFASSDYFRRVFKMVTGRTPREYRKTLMEM